RTRVPPRPARRRRRPPRRAAVRRARACAAARSAPRKRRGTARSRDSRPAAEPRSGPRRTTAAAWTPAWRPRDGRAGALWAVRRSGSGGGGSCVAFHAVRGVGDVKAGDGVGAVPRRHVPGLRQVVAVEDRVATGGLLREV